MQNFGDRVPDVLEGKTGIRRPRWNSENKRFRRGERAERVWLTVSDERHASHL